MPDKNKLDNLYMDIAHRIAQMSHAVRLKVGAVLVKDDNIISMGWNGTPAGADNNCETRNYDLTSKSSNMPGSDSRVNDQWPHYDAVKLLRYRLVTKTNVLHAESNALMKLIASGGSGSSGATLYVTHSPCAECAKLIKQAKITRVVYDREYRTPDGIHLLRDMGVLVQQIKGNKND